MIWTMKPTAKKLEDVETKVGNVGNTDLQSQVTTLNNKVGNVGSTDLQSQVNTLNSNFTALEIKPISSTQNVNGLKCFKLGSVVVVYGTVRITSDVTAWTTVMTFSSEYRPKASNAFLQVVNSDSSKYLEVVYTTGVVQISFAATSGEVFKVFGVWNV